MNFIDFALSDKLNKAIDELGYTEATEIQEKTIPLILTGKDVIGISQTGSGKTAAYGLPALEMIDTALDAKIPQMLILTPTRELAMQVTDELHKFSKYNDRAHIVPVYGGQPINRQVGMIRSGCQIIVGTPGRVIDLLNRRIITFNQIKMVILDEADEMLNMGFREDIEVILSDTPEVKQTILFSATMPQAIIDITGKYQKDPVQIKIESTQLTATGITQSYFEVPKGSKQDILSLLLQYYEPKLSLVFCNTKRMVDEVSAGLKKRGYSAEGLHGDMRQEQRTIIMNRFKNGGFKILVATDVAARGIDVNDIDIVFNYDLPDDCEYYVHRIGRTARAGKVGRSFTLIDCRKQYDALQMIAAKTKSSILKLPIPTVESIKDQTMNASLQKITDYAASHDCEKCSPQLELLRAKGMDYHDISAALLQMFLDNNTMIDSIEDVPGAENCNFVAESSPRKRNGDGRVRRSRVPNERAKEKFDGVDMSSVTISIGRNDKVAPKHILGAVAGESGLPGSIMGTIDIGSDQTTIDVPKQYKTRIIKALNHKDIKGKKVTAR